MESRHLKIVAYLHIAFGALSLLAAVIVFLSLGLAGGIVSTQGEHEAAGILGIIAFSVTGLLTLLSIPDLLTGWALLAERAWAKPLLIVISILNLLNLPFGTALGIYSLWALNLPEEKSRHSYQR